MARLSYRYHWFDTVWLSQAQLSELFGASVDNISLHFKNIYGENELDEIATTEDYSAVCQEGTRSVKRKIKHYNLDAIISVGYRVNLARATQIRQWAPYAQTTPFRGLYAACRSVVLRGRDLLSGQSAVGKPQGGEAVISVVNNADISANPQFVDCWVILYGSLPYAKTCKSTGGTP